MLGVEMVQIPYIDKEELTKLLLDIESGINTSDKLKKVNETEEAFYMRIKRLNQKYGFINTERIGHRRHKLKYSVDYKGIMTYINTLCANFAYDGVEEEALIMFLEKLKEEKVLLPMSELLHKFISARLFYFFSNVANEKVSLYFASMLVSDKGQEDFGGSDYMEKYGIKPFDNVMYLALECWEEYYKVVFAAL